MCLPPKMLIDCVMPAAGLSSRMGEWKLMLPYKKGVILDASIDAALSFCSRVILVGGYRFADLSKLYNDRENILLCHNKNYQQGMFSSIQVGVAQVKSEHFFICHADMPCISTQIYKSLWRERIDGIVFPGDSIDSGHPVLFSSKLIPDLISAPIKSRVKNIITNKPVKYLALGNNSIYYDIDTPEAYQGLLRNKS